MKVKPYELWVSERMRTKHPLRRASFSLYQWVDVADSTDFYGTYGEMRFNARFAERSVAETEAAWYRKHGYHTKIHVDNICRLCKIEGHLPVDCTTWCDKCGMTRDAYGDCTNCRRHASPSIDYR